MEMVTWIFFHETQTCGSTRVRCTYSEGTLPSGRLRDAISSNDNETNS
jgi:hypothetical protein